MRKFLKFGMLGLLCSAIMIASLFSFVKIDKKSPKAFADGETSGVSIFIRKPTYSVYYDDKVYFVDDADKFLKIYDPDESNFSDDYIANFNYTLVGSTLFENKWIFIVQNEDKNGLIEIDLDTLSVSEQAFEFDVSYTKIFVQRITFDSSDYILYSLSSTNSNDFGPKLYLYDIDGDSFQTINLTFDDNDLFTPLKNGLVKMVSYQSSNRLYLVFVYGSTVSYYLIENYDSLIELKTNQILFITKYGENILKTTNPDYSILNIDFMTVSGTDYIMVAYDNNGEQHISLYSFDFSSGTTSLSCKKDFSCSNANYLITNGDYYSYVDGQIIRFSHITTEIDPETSELRLSDVTVMIKNPEYEVSYFAEENFIYKKATARTFLYDNPWGATSNITLNIGTDFVVIGQANLVSNNMLIADYDYCLYTANKRNYTGFVKKTDSVAKTAVTPAEAGYKPRVAVWPESILYSLPTPIVGGKIGTENCNLSSSVVLNIDDNSEIQILDMLCNYTLSTTKMLKVKVNGTQVGYIKEECIRTPADIVDFVITNATIKNDNTVVYLAPNYLSTKLTFTLDKGKNIRINGSRNTKTGFTSITFNDEYGNEFSGYIKTDYIQSDTWSALQIFGSILVAINIGLLILILLYKKNHLGARGQKIEDEPVFETTQSSTEVKTENAEINVQQISSSDQSISNDEQDIQTIDSIQSFDLDTNDTTQVD